MNELGATFVLNIVEVKNRVSILERDHKRTPVWDYLRELLKLYPDDPKLADLCLHQMLMYLYDYEEDIVLGGIERDNERDD